MGLTTEQREKNREACKRWYRANKETSQRKTHEYAKADWGRYAIREVKRRSKDKCLECTIDAAWLNVRVAPMVCEATGLELIWEGPDRQNPWAPSVDRIDPSGGYTPDNVQVTCWIYNWAKGKWPKETLAKLAHAIVIKEKDLG